MRRHGAFVVLIAFGFVAWVSGCSGGGGGGGGGTGGGSSSVTAPSGLAYSTPQAVYIVGQMITPNTPSSSGSPPTSYSVQPALPAGLTLDTQTGIISGTPTAASPATAYLVEAANSAGSDQTVVTITVNAQQQPPAGLSYPAPPTYCAGMAITPLVPSISGGAPDSYSVAPPLPTGLSLDAMTGVISGTPQNSSSATTYTVTATNALGSTSAMLTIEVSAGGPCSLSYSDPMAVYIPTVSISPNLPVSSCGFSSFTVSPALPAGLTLDPATGIVSGTPTQLTAETDYVITATNSCTSANATISIRVTPIYYFTVNDQTVSYDQTTGQGTFTANILLTEDAQNPGFPHDLDAFSMALGHDSMFLTPTNVAEGPALLALNGGGGADFFAAQILPDGFTLGALFSLSVTDWIVADTAQDIVDVDYDTNPTTLAGNAMGAQTMLTWVSQLGSPPIDNIVTTAGVGFDPVLEDGTIDLQPMP